MSIFLDKGHKGNLLEQLFDLTLLGLVLAKIIKQNQPDAGIWFIFSLKKIFFKVLETNTFLEHLKPLNHIFA